MVKTLLVVSNGRQVKLCQHGGHIFRLAMECPAANTIHLVLDNLNIHKRKSLTDLLREDVGGEVWDRFTVHHTPTHGSWLNQAEIEIGLLSRQCLGSSRIPDLKSLRREVHAWNRDANRRQIKINWKFDRKAARRQFGYKRKSIRRSKNAPGLKASSISLSSGPLRVIRLRIWCTQASTYCRFGSCGPVPISASSPRSVMDFSRVSVAR